MGQTGSAGDFRLRRCRCRGRGWTWGERVSRGEEVYYTPEIFGNPHGSYADYNVVSAAIVARKPTGLSFVEASAIPLAGGTAWEAVIRRLAVRPGETILIHGAAGGVGSFAVQFAKAAGARVLASASADNQDLLRQLGADVTIDYRKNHAAEITLRETYGCGADAAFDIEGVDIVARCLPAVRPFGRIACILPRKAICPPFIRKTSRCTAPFLRANAGG